MYLSDWIDCSHPGVFISATSTYDRKCINNKSNHNNRNSNDSDNDKSVGGA